MEEHVLNYADESAGDDSTIRRVESFVASTTYPLLPAASLLWQPHILSFQNENL